MARYLDILGTVFSVPDPESVAALSANFQVVAMNIGDAKSGLNALGSPLAWADWTGQSADTFAGKIGELPGQLDKAWNSYTTAAQALLNYSSRLTPVVSALSALAFEAEDAEGVLRGTITTRNQIIREGQNPQTTGWDARLWEAEARVAAIQRRMFALRAELNDLSGQCVTQIRRAQAEGIQNNLVTDYQRYVLQDGAIVLAHGRIAMDVAGTILGDLFARPFTQLHDDWEHFDPHSFESWGAVLGDLAGALAIVAMVVALFVPGVDAVAFPALLALSVAATVADGGALVTHEKGASLTKVGLDVLSLAFLGVGTVAGRGVAKDQQLLDSAVGQGDLGQTQNLLHGADPQVSEDELQYAGFKRTFTWDGLKTTWVEGSKLENPIESLKDDAYSLFHGGADGYDYSPAAVRLQHIQFLADGGGDVTDVVSAEYGKSQQ